MSAAVPAVLGWACAGGAWLAMRLAAAAREERVARAAHEIRGPLTAARLAIDLACRPGGSPARALEAVELELARAGAAVEDLTGIGRPELEIVDLRGLVADCVAAAAAEAETAGAAVVAGPVPAGLALAGDPVRLTQALRNLIANALEHGRPGEGRHVVQVGVRVGEGSVRIEVSDRGRGLTAPLRELSAAARGGRGRRGRGLAIAARIAAAHGGRLSAAPSERGARLALELPLLREAGTSLETPEL